jgi:hypothetical protein
MKFKIFNINRRRLIIISIPFVLGVDISEEAYHNDNFNECPASPYKNNFLPSISFTFKR